MSRHVIQGNVPLDSFQLDCGQTLDHASVRFAMFGEPNDAGDNVVLICHALSGSARVDQWWPQILDTIDLNRWCVLGVNVLGSCYGTTGPCSLDPKTGKPYGPDFPQVSVRDIVRSQAQVLDQLGIKRLRAVIGGSIGGMQALQWAIDYPERVDASIGIGATPLSAMGLALNHLQRDAIRIDPEFRGGYYDPATPPLRGLATARGIAMCSYKSADLFDQRHGRNADRHGNTGKYDIAGYLEHQGRRFIGRFDANSYIALTRAMDDWDPARQYGSEEAAWGRMRAHVLLVGISSDWLFPARDVLSLSERLCAAGVNCAYREMQSAHGHDAFLAEAGQLAPWVRNELDAEEVGTLVIPSRTEEGAVVNGCCQ
jgi:homoserine O-acetyltransferase